MTGPNADAQMVGAMVAGELNKIAGLFPDGFEFCLVVWRDDLPKQDFIMSTGDLNGAMLAIARRQSDPGTKEGTLLK